MEGASDSGGDVVSSTSETGSDGGAEGGGGGRGSQEDESSSPSMSAGLGSAHEDSESEVWRGVRVREDFTGLGF
jgi:hypothetical protein